MSSAAPGEADGGAPLGNPGTGLRSIRWAWALWSTVSLLLVVYLVLAAVVSHAVTTPLTLSEGARVEMMLVRLFPDTLGLELEFRKDTDFRVKHGDWKYREDASAPGYLRRDQPGLPIRLRVSVSGGAPVLYEALYTTTTGVSYIRRRMTTDLSVEHGLRSLEPAPDVRPALSPGITRVAIEVESVSPALAGETTLVVLDPEVDFMACSGLACDVFALTLLFPYFAAFQLVWALLILVCAAILKRRLRPQGTAA